MANFNPVERGSLMDLLSSLGGGLSGETGWAVLQSILSGQQQRVDQRQQRLSSLSDFITGSAMQGMTYEGAQSLADAYTPGENRIPPRIENTISGLYPQQAGTINALERGPLPMSPQMTSPTFSPQVAPMTPQDQLAQVELQQVLQTAQTAPIVAQVLAEQDVNALIENGIPLEQVMAIALSSDTYAAMDTQTQAAYVIALQQALQQKQIEMQQQQTPGQQPQVQPQQAGGQTPTRFPGLGASYQ